MKDAWLVIAVFSPLIVGGFLLLREWWGCADRVLNEAFKPWELTERAMEDREVAWLESIPTMTWDPEALR